MSVPQRAFRNSRPTIGLLCDVPWNQYSCDMWAGVRDAACDEDANLLYFAGSILDCALDYRRQANVMYERITPEAIDGLVIGGGQLAHIVGAQGVETFCQRFRPLPMVSIELALPDIPSICINNYQGMYDLVTHLIEVHGYRRLAYIDYPTRLPVTEARYQGYADALRDHQLTIDPNLFTDGSGVDIARNKKKMETGQEVAYILFEQRGLRPRHDIDAIVTVADPTAFGVLTQLQSRGIRIPADVALVGFDDLAEARYQHPPLTTVRQSFYEQGRQAAAILLAQLRGEQVPDRTTLPAPVIVRRSCGCADAIPGHIRLEAEPNPTPPEPLSPAEDIARRGATIRAVCRARAGALDATDQLRREEQMLAYFLAEVTGESSASFSLAWENLLYEVVDRGGDLARWQEVLVEWYRCVFPGLPPEHALRAKNLWQRARIVLDALVQREQTYQQLQATQRTRVLHSIGIALITSFDISGLTTVLERELPKLGINTCYLALYAEPAAPAEWATLIFACNQYGRLEIPPQGELIPPHWLLPEGMFLHENTYSFMAAPLYFQATQIGFALLEAGQPDGMVYEVLRNQISSALHEALLVQRLQERTSELTREKYYFKERNNRFTKTNQAHAKRLELPDPSGEIGKSDFDFFSKEQAYLEIEQRVAERTAALQQEIAERMRAETEIRHLQHFLQNIIDSMPAIVMGVDLEGRVTFWNLEAAKITGLTVEVVQGKQLQEAFPPLAEQIGQIEHTLHSQTPQHFSKVALLWKEQPYYVDITIYPLIANAIEGAVILAVDVTEQVRIEDIVIQSEKMWTVGGLAAGLAHEINNPLSVMLQGIQNIRRRLALDVKENQAAAARIGLNLEQVRTYLETRRIWRYLQEMQTAGRHAEKIVANILNCSDYTAAEMRQIDLNHLLDNVLDLAANDYDLTNTYHFREVALLRNYETPLPRVACIANEIEQVLLNMIRNAVQALADRPANVPAPFIRLTTRQEAEYVAIAIEDNGIGMDENTRKHIFDPFFTTRVVGKGAGLGLAVAYFIIVVHHHGKIAAASTPQQGATFTLHLPIQSPARSEAIASHQ